MARLHRDVRLDRPDLPRRDGGRSRLLARAASAPRRHRLRFVRRARSSSRRWSPTSLLDWTVKASLIAGTALSTTSLAVVYAVLVERGLNDDARRQAPDERDLRHRHLHGDRALGDLHQAERLVPGLPRRLARADPRAAPDRALVLPPLRRPRDRAGDQARLRLPLRADGARRPGERSCRPSRLRPRARDEPALRRAPRRAAASPHRRLRLPDAVLLHQGRAQRLARSGLLEPRAPRAFSY